MIGRNGEVVNTVKMSSCYYGEKWQGVSTVKMLLVWPQFKRVLYER